MRKLTADYILDPSGQLVANHSLLIDETGMIIGLNESVDSHTEYFEGILCPGFINAHCHLELSHLKNIIPPKKRLEGFISDIIKARKSPSTRIHELSETADRFMWDNGIQAVGDICNTNDSFEIKKKSLIRYHSFIELFNFEPQEAEKTISEGRKLSQVAFQSNLQASIVPHAPYSVSPKLFELILKHHQPQPSLWCIHNQETESENEMFLHGTGALIDFFKSMGIKMDWNYASDQNSISFIRKYFPNNTHLLFVHNTYTSEKDIEFLKSANLLNQSCFCLCPKANLYIENKLPDINMLYESGCTITIGTDSLASNDSLSVLDELKTIHLAFPDIPIQNLLTWATRNGAEYFGWNDLGTFRNNTTPGVLLISKANKNNLQPTSEVKRLF